MTAASDAGQLAADVVTSSIGPTKTYPSDSIIRTLGFAGDVVIDGDLPIGYGDEVVIVLTARISDIRVRDAFIPGNPSRLRWEATVTDVHTLDGDDVRVSGKTEEEILREHSRRYVAELTAQSAADKALAEQLADQAPGSSLGRQIRRWAFPVQRQS